VAPPAGSRRPGGHDDEVRLGQAVPGGDDQDGRHSSPGALGRRRVVQVEWGFDAQQVGRDESGLHDRFSRLVGG
jgi:hypothetical protein